MIPEFAEILKRDRGSRGDTQARIKLRARKELAFVYFMCDFASPLYYWEPDDKRREALNYTDLTEKDIDEKIVAAMNKYMRLMADSSRALRSLRTLEKGMDALDNYYENIDFNEKDGDGRLLHNPEKFANQITKMNKMYEEYDKFRKRIEEELKQGGSGIRGTAVKGQNEDKVRTWSENDVRTGSEKSAAGAGPIDKAGVDMTKLGHLIHGQRNTSFTEEELES